jgi:menaquinone-specific isochorismate synthase
MEKIRRTAFKVSPVAIDQYLSQPLNRPHFYWRNRDRSFEILGIDLAFHLANHPNSLEEVRGLFSRIENKAAPAPKCFGGFQFNKKFNFWAFPKYEIMNSFDGTFLIQNLKEGETGFANELEFMEAMGPAIRPTMEATPQLDQRYDEPSPQNWESFVQTVIDQIKNSDLKKVVLARMTRLHYKTPIDPVYLFTQLMKVTTSCYHYYLNFAQECSFHGTFLGASPEQIFKRTGNEVLTEALAGTRPRGSNQEQDLAYATELLESAKEKEEHRLVKQWIESKLKPLSQELNCVKEDSILPLVRVQHLYSQYSGRLQNDVQDQQILETLHPTPALAGYPQESACQTIRKFEPFDRGWFTGSLGWISADSSEFVAGIRSSLVQHNVVSLYAGAGIVPGSIPSMEWEELNHKMSDYLRILNAV